MTQITTREEAVEIIGDEIAKHTTDDKIGSYSDYASGLFEGLTIGLNLDTVSFLAIHGTDQRLRHYGRQSLIRQKLMRDPSAPPAGVA